MTSSADDRVAGDDIDQSMLDALMGMVVLHSTKGAGKVVAVSRDLVAVRLGFGNVSIDMPADAPYAATLVADTLMDADHSMDWRIPTERFLADSNWSASPSADTIMSLLGRFPTADSIVVVNTNNPPRSHDAKVALEAQQHSYLERNGIILDEEFSALSYQMLNIFDWQLNAYLLRGLEPRHVYERRLDALVDIDPDSGWSEVILPTTSPESRERMIICMSYVAGALIASGTGPVEAILTTEHHIGRRLHRYLETVRGFTRGRPFDNRKTGQQR